MNQLHVSTRLERKKGRKKEEKKERKKRKKKERTKFPSSDAKHCVSNVAPSCLNASIDNLVIKVSPWKRTVAEN